MTASIDALDLPIQFFAADLDSGRAVLKTTNFYVAVIVILGTAIGAAHTVLGWSDGLTFAVGIVAGTITCTLALREDLTDSRRSPERRGRRA